MRKLLVTMGIAAGLLVPAGASAQQPTVPILPTQPTWMALTLPALTPSMTAQQVTPEISGAVADSVGHGGSEWLAAGIGGALLAGGILAAAAWEYGDPRPGFGGMLRTFGFGATIGFSLGALIGGQVPAQ